jgi:hypothetical protein
MRVTPETPVQDKDSYLFQWDSAARRYFHHFEVHKQAARENIRRLFQNVLTRNKDPLQYEHRFREVDSVHLRQLLGDISPEEVHELNQAFGSQNGSFYTKGNKEPASVMAWKIYPLGLLYVAAVGIAGYAKIIRGYNNLWIAGAFAPFWTYVVYNWARQPTIEIDNCYRYLLAKRAATCEL